MYWKEQEIDGVLCYQTAPEGEWEAYTPEQMTTMVQTYKQAYERLREVIDKEVA